MRQTWEAKGGLCRGASDEDAVDLARAHQRLPQQLPLRVLAAVKQEVALPLAQRYGWR
jgi:hypothetical protein